MSDTDENVVPEEQTSQESAVGGDENKANRKPTDSAYYAWSKTKPASDIVQATGPQKIGDGPSQTSLNHLGSAWNAGGTWEERDKTKWARDRIQALVLQNGEHVDSDTGFTIRVTNVDKCEGQAQIVYTRGRKRVGYEIDILLSWEATSSDGSQVTKGKIELDEFEDSSGEDFKVSITAEGTSEESKTAKAAVRRWEPKLRGLLSSWVEELREQ